MPHAPFVPQPSSIAPALGSTCLQTAVDSVSLRLWAARMCAAVYKRRHFELAGTRGLHCAVISIMGQQVVVLHIQRLSLEQHIVRIPHHEDGVLVLGEWRGSVMIWLQLSRSLKSGYAAVAFATRLPD